MSFPSCPDCQACESRLFLVKQGLRLLRCGQCRLIWLDRSSIEEQTLQDAYPSAYFEGYERRWRRKVSTGMRRLRWLARFQKPGSLLDVGCSIGHFVAASESLGWKAYGIDPSVAAIRLARQHGLNVVCGLLEEVGFPPFYFEMVTLWHVIEHVPNPRRMMEEVHRILAPDGIAVLFTPNIAHPFARLTGPRWRHIHDHHLFYFTPETLIAMLSQIGFRIEACRTLGRHTSMLVVARAIKSPPPHCCEQGGNEE